jgi:hypothetical protein
MLPFAGGAGQKNAAPGKIEQTILTTMKTFAGV